MRRNRPWFAAALMLPDDNGGGGGSQAGTSGDGADAGGGAGAGTGGAGGGGNTDSGGNDNSGNDTGDDEWKSEHSKKSALADLKAARTENQTLKAKVQQLEDANKPEDQKAREAREKQEETARSNARFRAQAQAAREAGLSLEWVERIAGATPEEMLADAKALKQDLDDRSSAGQSTDGAGAAGSGDPAAAAAPGVGRLDAYYASSNKK